MSTKDVMYNIIKTSNTDNIIMKAVESKSEEFSSQGKSIFFCYFFNIVSI